MWGKYCYVGQQTSLYCLHGLTTATAKYKAETAGVIIEGAKAVVPTQLPNCLPTLHVNKILLNSELKSNLFDKCLLTNTNWMTDNLERKQVSEDPPITQDLTLTKTVKDL
jgi:hypothetical protein